MFHLKPSASILAATILFHHTGFSETPEPQSEPPKLLATSELRDFEALTKSRQILITAAMQAAKEVSGMAYLYGGNGVKDGGFDCSGAMYHILRKIGLNPPRTSYAQFLWVQKDSEMHMVSTEAKDLEDASLAMLKSGDLVFWSGTYQPTDNRLTNITHVGIFIGYEKKDGHPVMINSSDGRSYRGKKQSGLGVNDFRIPKIGGKSHMVGYGTPPKLEPVSSTTEKLIQPLPSPP
jgi:hypothetical protein